MATVKYAIVDFRANMRQAFNEADNGRTVLIERYGQMYRLSSLVGEPDETGAYHASKHDKKEDNGLRIKPTKFEPNDGEDEK